MEPVAIPIEFKIIAPSRALLVFTVSPLEVLLRKMSNAGRDQPSRGNPAGGRMAVLKTFVLPAVHPKAASPNVGSTMTYAQRYATGKALRETCPRKAHSVWKAATNRRDAVQQVLEAEKGRLPELLPLRHGRMVRSAFTFYRGAALTMAADLASTPSTGVRVQCCGDAHLSNFGGFATAERKIIFSINDLDETLPAPWEWDVKRLAASFVWLAVTKA